MSRQGSVREQKTAYYRRAAGEAAPPDIHLPVPGGRTRAPAAPGSRRWWPLAVLAALVLLLVGAGSLSAAAFVYQRGRILPGVHTLGVDLGGLRAVEARAALSHNWESRQVILDAGDGHTHSLPPTDLGIELDAEATAQVAYRQGRELAGIERAVRAALSNGGFQPVWRFDPAVARRTLGELSEQISVPAVDAGIRYANGQVETTAAVPGRALDLEETVSWLQQNAGLVVLSGRLPLVVHTVAPALVDSSAIAAELNGRLQREIAIYAYDPVRDENHDAVVPAKAWTAWLRLEADPNAAGGVRWEVDRQQVEAYLTAQAAAFGSDRYLETEEAAAALVEVIRGGQGVARMRIYHRPTTHTVQPGETLSSIAYDYGIPYPWIQQANPDSGDGLRPGQTLTVPSPDVLLPLPPVEGKRIVVSLSQQRMWVYENGAVRWEWPVSTGIDSSPTAPGIFQIQSHEENAYAGNWDLWMPHFMGIYRPVPTSNFMNGFHGFPTRNGANLLWTNSLGRRVTYGCILISNDNAPLLYEWAQEGVVVEVQR